MQLDWKKTRGCLGRACQGHGRSRGRMRGIETAKEQLDTRHEMDARVHAHTRTHTHTIYGSSFTCFVCRTDMIMRHRLSTQVRVSLCSVQHVKEDGACIARRMMASGGKRKLCLHHQRLHRTRRWQLQRGNGASANEAATSAKMAVFVQQSGAGGTDSCVAL